LFADLLYSARDGDRYYWCTRSHGGKRNRVLIPRTTTEHGDPCVSFPADAFEAAVLSMLRELDPKGVLGDAPGQDRVMVLSSELRHAQTRQAEPQAALSRGPSPTLEKAARAADLREAELRKELEAARREAAFPAAEAWGEMVSIAGVLNRAPD